MKSKELSNKYKEYVINLRREFHMYPEPCWQEFRTSNRIKEELTKMGIPFIEMAKTGVLGTIKGKHEGKTIALRADMDALELEEKNEIVYRSKNDGFMHACGHDGHTAMLLGAAKILNEMKEEIKGTVRLIFQPAEEMVEGAQAMVKEGCLDTVDNIFGMHLWSQLETGKISAEEGPRMANGGWFKIRVKGKGGHGSEPNKGIDALVAASAIVMNLQSIVSREFSPLESVVVSIGVFKSGTRLNILPSEAYLEGIVRNYSNETDEKLAESINRIVKCTAESYRAEAEVEFTKGKGAVINDPQSSKRATKTVEKLFGRDALALTEKVTGGEDFAIYLQKVPGVFAFLGAGNEEKGTNYPTHHERFNIDEDALEVGTALYVQYALDFLNE